MKKLWVVLVALGVLSGCVVVPHDRGLHRGEYKKYEHEDRGERGHGRERGHEQGHED
ncbi:MAG: hypothetical protein AB1400_08935 [Pseudomonadota bacterium]